VVVVGAEVVVVVDSGALDAVVADEDEDDGAAVESFLSSLQPTNVRPIARTRADRLRTGRA
jgi:hypothetical protein